MRRNNLGGNGDWKVKLKELNKYLGRLNVLMKKKHQNRLQKRCKLKEREKPKVKEEILQGFKANTGKVNRCQQTVSQFQQNSFFRNNEGQFHRLIDGCEEGEEIVIPDAQESKTFWTEIFGTKKWNI